MPADTSSDGTFRPAQVRGLARRDASTVTQVMRGQQDAVVDGGSQLQSVLMTR